jgi:hypothetical protein
MEALTTTRRGDAKSLTPDTDHVRVCRYAFLPTYIVTLPRSAGI